MQVSHTKNMRAAIVTKFGGPEVLELTEIQIPTPNSHQVLIRVHASSVNFADINARKGMYHLGKKPPFIPGIDCAGVVAEVGANVTNIDVNQMVVAFPTTGSYAEFALAEESLAPFGRIVLFGNLAAADNSPTSSTLFTLNQSILGFSFGHYRRYRPEDIRDTMDSVINLVAAGKIEMQIAKRIPLKNVQRAHRLLENQEVLGKLILMND